MNPVTFPEANTIFAKDQPEYLPLPAHYTAEASGRATSCWALSLRERFRVLVTGRVFLAQLIFNQPLQPVHLSTRFKDQ